MTPRYIHEGLVFNPHGQLLLMADHTLPQFETNAHFWQTCEPIYPAMRDQFGLDTVTVRCLQVDFGKTECFMRYHLVCIGGEPDTGAWVNLSDVKPELRTIAQDALHFHPKQPAWYASDWYTQLSLHFPNARLQQVRSWERSAVWRVWQDEQVHYLKAIPTMFGYELPLTCWLAEQFPASVVTLQAIDAHLMLTPEYTGRSLDASIPLTTWENVLTTYAAMQIQTMAKIDAMQTLGVPVRSMEWIATISQQLLADEHALRRGERPLSDVEIQQLQAIVPQLQPHFDHLRDVVSLEHGDFWNGQVFVDAQGHVTLTDFSDAALTHPFFSLVFFLFDIENTLSHESDVTDRLTAAYLKPYRERYANNQLQAMIASAKLISPLYSACRYYADILPQMAHPWEMENMLAFNLRLVLDTATK